MARSHEPIFWAPFSAGMMIDALVIPALVVITGLLAPLGLVSEDTLGDVMGSLLWRPFVFVVVALSLFHAAHRLRFALVDLGLKPFAAAIAVLMYGGAIAGTVVAAAVAFDSTPVCAMLAACNCVR